VSAWEGVVPVAGGVRLRARIDDGPDGAPTVLLVNGLMMAIEAWQGLADDLLADHRVVRYDQRGQGRSDDPEGPHRIETHAEDLVALVANLTRDHGLGRFHLVGLSSGAPAAVLAAAALEADTPGRLLTLTSCDGFVVVDAHLRLVVRAWLAAHEVGGPAHRFDVATPWVWGQAFLRDQEAALSVWRAAAATTDGRRAHALIAGMAAFEADAGPALATLRCPVLALHGEDDVMTPARHGRALLRHARDGRLVTVSDAGHAAPIERPAAVAAALRAFWSATVEPSPSKGPRPPRTVRAKTLGLREETP
jgi:3-oxoadipate enol-lactonase